jgi:hypothetical protein
VSALRARPAIDGYVCPLCDGELAFALVAIYRPGRCDWLLPFDFGIGVAARRADRTIGPARRLKGFAGLVIVVKHGVLKNRFGRRYFNHHVLSRVTAFVLYINAKLYLRLYRKAETAGGRMKGLALDTDPSRRSWVQIQLKQSLSLPEDSE